MLIKEKIMSYSSIAMIGGVVLFSIIGAATSVSSTNSNEAQSTITKAESTTTTKTVTTKEYINYSTSTKEDAMLDYGTTKVQTSGARGEVTSTYKVTYVDGKEVSRELVGKEITKQPVDEVILKGTKIIWKCVDVTSYDRNQYNDNKCASSTGEVRFLSDSQAEALDPTYKAGKYGPWYYNNK